MVIVLMAEHPGRDRATSPTLLPAPITYVSAMQSTPVA